MKLELTQADGHRPLQLGLILLGLTSMVVQLVCFRELLCVFFGNELVIGIVLGNWLLLTGLGAAVNRILPAMREVADHRRSFFWGALMVLAPLAVIQVLMLRLLPGLVFGSGAAPGVAGTFLYSLVIMAPFCLLSGWLLTCACELCRELEQKGAGVVYFADSLGGLLGGLVVTYLLLGLASHMELLLGTGFFHVAVVWWLGRGGQKARWFGLEAASCGLLLAIFWGAQLDAKSIAWQYPGQGVRFFGESPYGRVVLTDSAGQLNCLVNGKPATATHNQSQIEEIVHYAMAQRPQAKHVLVLCGTLSGLVREVLKYPVPEVTCVEADSMMIRLSQKHGGDWGSDPRVRWVTLDGRRFLRKPDRLFDVILVNVPDPSTMQLNRYYTSEFYQETKLALKPDGVLAFSLGGYENYMSDPLAKIMASAHRTVQQAFSQVLVLPGLRTFFLASEGPLTQDIPQRLLELGIETTLLKPGFWKAMISSDRLDDAQRAVTQPAGVNRDLDPVLHFYHLRHWISQYSGDRQSVWGAGILIFLLGVLAFRFHVVLPAALVSGFTASSLQVVLLIVFQALVGSMYQEMAVMNALCMAGLALGAWWGNRLESNLNRKLSMVLAGLAFLAFLLPFCCRQLHAWRTWSMEITIWVIPWLGMMLSMGVGLVFSMACRILPGSTRAVASSIYAADCLGAFAGAILSGVYLIPVWGISRLAASLALLNGALAVYVWVRRSASGKLLMRSGFR